MHLLFAVVAMEREAALQQYALTSKENSLYEMQYKQDVDELVDRISTLSVKNDVFPVEQRRTKKEISARVEKLDQRRARKFPSTCIPRAAMHSPER